PSSVFSAITGPPEIRLGRLAALSRRPHSPCRSRGLAVVRLFLEVQVQPAGGRQSLAAVFAAPAGAIRAFGGGGHLHERDLADAPARVDGDWQIGQVADLQGDAAVEAGLDIARCRVD